MQLLHTAAVISLTILVSSITQSVAQSPATETNLTAVMSAHGCKLFATTLASGFDQRVFEANVQNGLTILCPPDASMKAVLSSPEYKKLDSNQKGYFLQYHAIVGYKNMRALKARNGEERTLASSNEFRFAINVKNQGKDVILQNKLGTARVVNTIIDIQPLVIYRIDKALMPTELFKSKGGSI